MLSLFAASDNPVMNPIVMLAFVAAILGVLVKMYMLVFRNKEWSDYQEGQERIKRDRAERLGKAAKGAFSIAKWFIERGKK
jgi:hypothetical protein